MHQFTNPFPDAPKTGLDSRRIFVYTDKEAFDHIRRMRTRKGTVNIVFNILIKKLQEALNRYDLTDYTQTTQFEQFIANAIIVDGRPPGDAHPDRGSSPQGRVAEATGRPAPGAGSEVEDGTHISTNPKGRASRKRAGNTSTTGNLSGQVGG